ncbi:MAG: hypothetical protein QXG02_02690 [Candidatus Anstonellales archaeon]
MKKHLSPLLTTVLFATHVNATGPLSTAKNQFNQDSVARRILIEDAVGDGKIGIGTVEKAYTIYTKKGDDLERAMWLALMKDPALLEDYMSRGMRKDVRIVYPNDARKTLGNVVYYLGGCLCGFGMAIFTGWIEVHKTVINSNGK